MTIHNLMEDFVYNEVNKAFEAAKDKNEPWFTCNCMQCRLDTVCYVLNRIKPRYTASGRGMAHFFKLDKLEKNQLLADIERNGNNGIGHPEPLKENLSGYWSRTIDEKR